MHSIILALPHKAAAKHIAGLLRRHGIDCPIFCTASTAATVRQAMASDAGVVVAAPVLTDTGYAELYDQLPQDFTLLVLTKDERLESLGSRMQCLALPLNGRMLAQRLELLLQGKRRPKKARRKPALPPHPSPPKLRTPEEEAVITRAKEILMAKGNLTEDAAHRTLQQKAMQERRTLLDVAQLLVLLHQDWEGNPLP